jgi:transposase-like protein
MGNTFAVRIGGPKGVAVKTYSKEFKLEAVRRMKTCKTISGLAAELGVARSFSTSGESNSALRERRHWLGDRDSRGAESNWQHPQNELVLRRKRRFRVRYRSALLNWNDDWAPSNWKSIFSGAPSSMSGE